MSVAGSLDSNVNSNLVIIDPIDPNLPFPLLASSFLIMMKAVVGFNLLTGNRDADNIIDVHHPAVKELLKEDIRNVISICYWNGLRLADAIPNQAQKKRFTGATSTAY